MLGELSSYVREGFFVFLEERVETGGNDPRQWPEESWQSLEQGLARGSPRLELLGHQRSDLNLWRAVAAAVALSMLVKPMVGDEEGCWSSKED